MTATAGETTQARQQYAGMVSRAVGLAVDVGVLTVASLAVGTLPVLAWGQVVGNPPAWVAVVAGTVAALVPWGYFTACWWLSGRTGGALLVGVQVRHRDGGPVRLPQAALRAFVGLALWPIWAVGMLAILWDPRRRAWHDRLFRTVVLFGDRRPDPPARVR